MSSLALIILGMHRSGTSAFTGSLNCLGVDLGNKLYSGHAEINAKGYWENSKIVDLHDELLQTLGSRWDDLNPLTEGWESDTKIKNFIYKLNLYIDKEFTNSKIWGLKDPRMCRLLPLWQNILNERSIVPHYIFIFRHPLEVARSLRKRNGFLIDRGLFLWLDHNINAEKYSRSSQRSLFSFDQLLDNPRHVFERLEKDLDGALPNSVNTGWACIEKFIESDLRHHQDNHFNENNKLEKLAKKLHNKLIQLTNKEFTDADADDLDLIYAEFDQYVDSLPKYLLQNIKGLNHDYAHIRSVWRDAYDSVSWQIMKPVRFLERVILKNHSKL